jgi:hypothetical protein
MLGLLPGAPALASRAPSVPELAGVGGAQMRAVARYGRYVAMERTQPLRAARAVRYARRQLGKPYVFGASGPDAFDCSGLTMRAWGRAGVPLAHYVPTQYREVPVKVPFGRIRAGDLVMFNGNGHVGIAISRTRFIDAPETGQVVRVDPLSGWYRENFTDAVRPGEPAPVSWPASVVHAYQAARQARRRPSATPESSAPVGAGFGQDWIDWP